MRQKADITKTEQMILNLLWDGHETKEIAHRLRICQAVVHEHKQNLRRKWGCRNNVQLVRRGLERRYLTIGG